MCRYLSCWCKVQWDCRPPCSTALLASASTQCPVWCLAAQVPFLLKGSLREYQHVGLEWLITIYTRRLNGILADEVSRCTQLPSNLGRHVLGSEVSCYGARQVPSKCPTGSSG